jgi:hypothetical protein
MSFARTICVLFFGGVASLASAVVPTPTVTLVPSDPVGSANRNYTFLATDLDLAGRGYVEQEFFYTGTANEYDTPPMQGGIGTGPAHSTANIKTTDHPYKTRMVVRRPTSPAKFNGVVVVEWQNVTGGNDIEALWFRDHEFLMREGYAWVGISAQQNGIAANPNGLRAWSPARYGTLDVTDGGKVTGDLLSYDVFGQGIQAIRNVPLVMGGLPVKRVIATGVSQSGGRLAIYLNAVHARDPSVVDAALLIIGGQQVRPDLTIPVIKVLSETEYAGPESTNQLMTNTLQDDSAKFRLWSMSGVSHSDWASGIVRNAIVRRDLPNANLYDACPDSRSRVPGHHVLAGAIDALKKWVEEGKPAAMAPRMTYTSANPAVVVRDQYGNIQGGIRVATFAVPTAVDQGVGTGPALCFLNGVHRPFDKATLQQLYPTHDAYVDAIKAAAAQNVKDGFVLQADANEMIADAQASIIGMNLTCGPRCENRAQFPINPSTQILRDQTQLLYIANGQELLTILDSATKLVAEGYTAAEKTDAASQAMAKSKFQSAITALRSYIEKVQALPGQGRAQPVTVTLLVDFANTLIERIAFEANLADPLISVGPYASIRVVEFNRTASTQYFLGHDPAERASLDSTVATAGWARTGAAFTAYLPESAGAFGTVPVCRFVGKPGVGPASHLFTANAAECEAVKANPAWIFEGVVFRALPLVNGGCAAGQLPMIRLWRAGANAAASRHRFTTDPVKAQTLANFEGYTIEGPTFCVLPWQ